MKILNENIQGSSFELIRRSIQDGDSLSLKGLLGYEDLKLMDSVGWTAVHEAARCSNSNVMQLLLEDSRGQDLLHNRLYDGNTPLMTAIRYSNIPAVRTLLNHGSDIFYLDPHSHDTVLHYAARHPNCDIMNVLLGLSPSKDFINATNKSGDTALDVALKVNSPTVQLLLQAGADYLKRNSITGRTILHTSIAYGQCRLVQELLSNKETRLLVDEVDHRGDIPLMLAIRIDCSECVKCLSLYMKPDKSINKITEESVLHIAVKTNNIDILNNVLVYSNISLINQTDSNGMTPLLLAIEEEKYTCLERLIRTQNINIINSKNSETVLHAAIRTGSCRALTILLQSQDSAIFRCFSQKNKEGKTPFWVAIESGNATFIMEARKGCWIIDVDECNNKGDSCLFVAAAYGHLNVLRALLLSEKYYTFSRIHGKDTPLDDYEFIRNAEVCCDIYSADIFILSGEEKKEMKQTSWPPKSFFRSNKNNGRNVFHACALSGNVHCLEFVYKLCKLFYFDVSLFDAPDMKGNTPLLLATKNDYGGPECVYFFLTNEASILNKNDSGETVLESLLTNTQNAHLIMIRLLNQGISYDKTVRGLEEDNACLQLNFSLLQHKNEPVTKAVTLIDELTKDDRHQPLLQHILLKTYINLILFSLRYFFMLRFCISCISTLLLTMFILVFSQSSGKEHRNGVFKIVRTMIIILNIVGIHFSIPLLICKKIDALAVFTSTLMLLPCFLTFILMYIPNGSDLFYELASVTVLMTWLSLLMYSTSVFKRISHQISMLFQVIYGMFVYSRIVIAILLPFSLCFYCLFNDHFYFVSPIKAFVSTAFILLEGDLTSSFKYFESKHFTQNEVQNNSEVNSKLSYLMGQFNVTFESMFLLIFIVACVLALVNMLVGLAVRGSKTLTTEGEVFQRRLQIHWLNSLEMFLNSRFYKLFQHTPFIYLFGIIPSMTNFDLNVKYVPTYERGNHGLPRATLTEMKRIGSTAAADEYQLKRTIINAMGPNVWGKLCD